VGARGPGHTAAEFLRGVDGGSRLSCPTGLAGGARRPPDSSEILRPDPSAVATKIERMADRPFFQPEQAPRGVYRGDVCDLVYDLNPVPPNDQWIAEFRKELGSELEQIPGLNPGGSFLDSAQDTGCGSPVVAPDADGGRVVCTVTVKTSATVKQLASVDDAVFNALSNAGAAVQRADADLEDKLAQVRKRRADTCPNAEYR
jgi:hypothetical protein